MFNTLIALENDEISGKIIIDSYFFEPYKYEFAFHLIEICDGDRRVKRFTKSYSDSNEMVYNRGALLGEFYIRCFIRDKEERNVRTFNSQVLSVN